ncbi:hypothetical protein EPYR_01596 [Erwinia pyrifoliae DSM 12163]|nr:hypothetical protein EPYR_01596 [Erwinia pyrifoliae DSM 12163]
MPSIVGGRKWAITHDISKTSEHEGEAHDAGSLAITF